jgi:hypothetical protein
MTWEKIFELIPAELMIVVAACWVLGFVLKRTPKVPNWAVIFILLVFAISFSVWMLGFTPEVIMQAILCAAFATYGYEMIKSALEGIGKQN